MKVVEQLNLNPFEIFGVPFEFHIENLEKIYFELFQQAKNDLEKLSKINQAYLLLKNPILRAKTLCRIFNFTKPDMSVAKIVFTWLNLPMETHEKLRTEIYEKILEFAQKSDWKNTWHYLQKYAYINRLIEDNSQKH